MQAKTNHIRINIGENISINCHLNHISYWQLFILKFSLTTKPTLGYHTRSENTITMSFLSHSLFLSSDDQNILFALSMMKQLGSKTLKDGFVNTHLIVTLDVHNILRRIFFPPYFGLNRVQETSWTMACSYVSFSYGVYSLSCVFILGYMIIHKWVVRGVSRVPQLT